MIKKRVGVLISGRGSNMRALVEASRNTDYPAEVVFVASNKADAKGLDFARDSNIATAVIDHTEFSTRELFDAALNTELQKHALDLVC